MYVPTASFQHTGIKLPLVAEFLSQSFADKPTTGQRQRIQQIAIGIVATILNDIEQRLVKPPSPSLPALGKTDRFFQRVTVVLPEIIRQRLAKELIGSFLELVLSDR